MTKEKIKNYIPKNAKVEFFGNTAIFEISSFDLKNEILNLHKNKKLLLKLVTATDERKENGCFKIWYIFGSPKENIFIIPFIKVKESEEFPSISLIIHKAWNYENKISSFFGLKPIGHPDNRTIILHENWPTNIFPLRKDFNWQKKPAEASGKFNFQKVKGEGIYEIPVGPIHAGIIEPGHFRFSVAGENIVFLEPRLGYTHKGSEKLFEILPLDDKIKLSEKISGDSSFSHSLAFCQALEQLSDSKIPKRASYLRVIYAELERLANHFGDIGSIMMDTGFSFGGAQGARLREMIMQINEKITGSRFLRGVNVIGGVTKNINNDVKIKLANELQNILDDFIQIIQIAENSSTLLNRLQETGKISSEIANDFGAVGIIAKSVGFAFDARLDYSYAAYDESIKVDIPTEQAGDVYARFRIRVSEVYSSIEIIKTVLDKLPKEDIILSNQVTIFKKRSIAIGVVEGWRGEIIYFITTDSNGNISRVFPHDPSIANWPMIGFAGLNNIIPDFPLINKSFNMSYSGNDL